MEREIKFRVWDSFNKRMDYSPCISFNVVDDDGTVDTWIDKGGGKWRSATTQMKLLQYTGFKDKQGKEIYEGDIVKAFMINTEGSEIWKGLIKFIAGAFTLLDRWIIHFENIEIIGNIYENPELLNP